jgi:hypothetical protein
MSIFPAGYLNSHKDDADDAIDTLKSDSIKVTPRSPKSQIMRKPLNDINLLAHTFIKALMILIFYSVDRFIVESDDLTTLLNQITLSTVEAA